MIGIIFCSAAFVLAFLAGRRGLVAGLSAVFAVGYAYGILRANFPDPATHFVFDCAVVALYLTQLTKRRNAEERRRTKAIQTWTLILIAWPVVMMLIPIQDPLVQLVGLRGNIFLLPFLLLGSRLRSEDINRLALTIAVLNIMAFAMAGAEYIAGIERFFPRNSNTEIIYRSSDVGGDNQFRIPSSFTGSHAYAGAMVLSLPFLMAAWSAARIRMSRRILLSAGIGTAALGVFAAASRTHTVVLAAVLLGALFSGAISAAIRIAMLGGASVLSAIVFTQQRLQRFTSLTDTETVSDRVTYSVNTSFFDLLTQYPLGNGMGGGGTSLPYFLQDRLRNPVIMENDYARMLLEQTVIGLLLWMAFLLWFVTRRFTAAARSSWGLGEHVGWIACVMYFGTALIGIGLYTSIPQSAYMLLAMGWIAAKAPERAAAVEYVFEYEAVPAGA